MRKKMRAILIFILGLKITDAVTHSHGYIYTATSGIAGFPEFVSVGMVDGQQVSYFDTHSMKMVPKTDWVREAVDSDFWNRNAKIFIATHQTFKNNIEVAKQRFNQTDGVHTFMRTYGCEWDDETGVINGIYRDGYDGEDFVIMDYKELRYIALVPQGVPSAQKWTNERGNLEQWKNYLGSICVEWLQKYLQYGKSSLEKTVSPQVSVLQKDSSSPVMCHATGFYPKEVTISWKRNEQDHDEDVDLGELLPNEDGTFQKTSTLKVTADELKKNKFSCVVEHQGKTIREVLTDDSVPIGIIVGVVAALILLVVGGVVVFVVYRRKKDFKPVPQNQSGDNSSAGSS